MQSCLSFLRYQLKKLYKRARTVVVVVVVVVVVMIVVVVVDSGRVIIFISLFHR